MKKARVSRDKLTVVDGATDTKSVENRRYCERLLGFHALFTNDAGKTLRPGMLARWKPGLKNRIMPEYGVAVVVVEILLDRLLDSEHGCGSQYFREPLDIIMGFIDDDGDFTTLHYDSRRFEPYPLYS